MELLTIWMPYWLFICSLMQLMQTIRKHLERGSHQTTKFHWRIMWAAASAVLLYTLWYGWYMNGGDIVTVIKQIGEIQWYRNGALITIAVDTHWCIQTQLTI